MARDVADVIVSRASEAFEEACKASEFEVHVTMRRTREPYVITVTPADQHVVFQYGGLRYRVPRDDPKRFRDFLGCLYGMLQDESEEADAEDELDPDFESHMVLMCDPDNQPHSYLTATIEVLHRGQVLPKVSRVPMPKLEGVFMRRMGAMQFLMAEL